MVSVDYGERWNDCLLKAKEHLRIADHMAYVTFSILKENRMMMRIVSELSRSVSELIKAFLYYESYFKRVKVYVDSKRNLKTFVEKIAPRYLENKDLAEMIRILRIEKQHGDAPVEFVRRDKFVILLGDKYQVIDMKMVREMLNIVRRVITLFPAKDLNGVSEKNIKR